MCSHIPFFEWDGTGVARCTVVLPRPQQFRRFAHTCSSRPSSSFVVLGARAGRVARWLHARKHTMDGNLKLSCNVHFRVCGTRPYATSFRMPIFSWLFQPDKGDDTNIGTYEMIFGADRANGMFNRKVKNCVNRWSIQWS